MAGRYDARMDYRTAVCENTRTAWDVHAWRCRMKEETKGEGWKIKNRFLLYLWMLPQNLLGLLVLFIFRKKKTFVEPFNECRVYALESKFLSGASLGRYIYVNRILTRDEAEYREAVRHEYGHFRQGKLFGVFYLLAVGAPSVLNNLFARKNKKVSATYYQRYPEKWADRLGRVRR